MRKVFRKYLRLYIANWSATIQYRGDFYLWGVAQSINPLVAMAIWYKISISTNIGFTPQEAFAYFITVIFLSNVIYGPDGFLFGQDILQGRFTQHLVKPYQAWLSYLTEALVMRSVVFLMFTPILVLLFLLAPTLFTGLVLTPVTLALFIVSACLGAGIFFTLDTFLATTAFWFEESHEIRRFKHVFEIIASGIFVPYAPMPETLQAWLSYLPFRYTLSAPVEIISGQALALSPLNLITIQIVWLTSLAILFRIAYRRGLKVYAIPTQ